MKSLKNMTGDSLEQMIDYTVVDQDGKHIGSLHSLWSDPTTGGVEFLGVKTGWLFGHNHVVPAEKAELDEAESVVRLPYTEVFIKEAPSIPADSEISELEEDSIYQYYGLPSPTKTDLDITAIKAAESGAAVAVTAEASGARWRRIGRDETAPPLEGAAQQAGDLNPVFLAAGMANMGTIPMATANLSAPIGFGLAAPFAEEMPAESETPAKTEREANPDPLTGEPGSHPAGTGVGAVAGGAAGLAIGGVIGGPVGAPVGAAIGALAGAIGGALAGKGVAEAINPTDEDAFWAAEYRRAPDYDASYDYSDYAPAYRTGYEGYSRYSARGREYAEVEPDLEREYMKSRGTSRLEWGKARSAARAAWDRLQQRSGAR